MRLIEERLEHAAMQNMMVIVSPWKFVSSIASMHPRKNKIEIVAGNGWKYNR